MLNEIEYGSPEDYEYRFKNGSELFNAIVKIFPEYELDCLEIHDDKDWILIKVQHEKSFYEISCDHNSIFDINEYVNGELIGYGTTFGIENLNRTFDNSEGYEK